MKEFENYDSNDHYKTGDDIDRYEMDENDNHYEDEDLDQENNDIEDHYFSFDEYNDGNEDENQDADDMIIEIDLKYHEQELSNRLTYQSIRKLSQRFQKEVSLDNQEKCPICGHSYNKVQQARIKYKHPVRCVHCGQCQYNKRR